MWKVVSGKVKKPASDDKLIPQWKSLNDKALAFLGLGSGDQVTHHLDFDDTAHEMWTNWNTYLATKSSTPKCFSDMNASSLT